MENRKSKYSFEYPECWKDETRMNALFAPFRDREVNPIFYDVKMKFWKGLIEDATANLCHFTVQDLNTAFTRNRRIPYCTTNVVKDLVINGDVRTKEEFLAATPSQSWKKWAVQTVVINPLWWSYGKLKQSIGYEHNDVEILDNKTYVHMASVKNKSESLLSIAQDNDLCGKVFAYEDLKQKLAKEEDSTTFNLCIHWLYVTGSAITMMDPNDTKRQLVKLAEPNDKVKPINEQELAMFSLQYNENKLVKLIETLENEKEQFVIEAKNYLKKGLRLSAKNSLRKKRELEKRIDKHCATLENIQVLLENIKDAESNNKVVESYKYGLAALKSTFQVAGQTADNVADTMDEVKDILETNDEIKDSIGSPLSPSGYIDENELENELSELLSDDTSIPTSPKSRKVPAAATSPSNISPTSSLSKLLNNLPEPPMESPTNSPKEKINNLSKMQKIAKLEGL